jgi:thioredoxin 1
MNEEIRQTGERSINYDLSISEKEALSGVQKILRRNGKRLQVNIPSGVNNGSIVKLTNALQITDGKAGDILIKVNIMNEQPGAHSQHSAGVVEINDTSFENEVLKADLPVAVDFWAPWCGPCRMMAPIMEKAAIQYEGKFKFCKINVDENPQMASQYKAMSIPLIIFFKGSQVVDKSLGAIPETQLIAKIEALLNKI